MAVQSKRRQQAYRDLGLVNPTEVERINKAIAKEEHRQQKKEMRKMEIETSSMYLEVKSIATYMDKYFLDAIIGLVPVIGDFLSFMACLPSIYVSLVKIRSIPLTLAVTFNALADVFIGIIPWLGNILDFFNRANLKNFKLITGFVEDDRTVIDEVNKRAVWMAILIVVMCFAIYFMIVFLQKMWNWAGGAFDYLYHLFV